MNIPEITEFLRTHSLISVRALEKKVGIPATALSAVVSGNRGRLAEKYVKPLTEELSLYGFKPTKRKRELSEA